MFCASNSLTIIRITSSSSASSIHSIIMVVTRTFSLKRGKNYNNIKKVKLVVFNQVTNYLGTKTKRKTKKYQTPRWQNSYSSSFLFPNIVVKMEAQIHEFLQIYIDPHHCSSLFCSSVSSLNTKPRKAPQYRHKATRAYLWCGTHRGNAKLRWWSTHDAWLASP